jgi:hypothetical protein
MGACCNNQPQFTRCKDQDHLKELIKEERKPFDAKFDCLNSRSVTDVIEINSNWKTREQPFFTPVKTNEDNSLRVLQLFIEGLDEVENNLNVRKFEKLKQLGEILEKFFEHGNDNEESHILSIKENLHQWFLSN